MLRGRHLRQAVALPLGLHLQERDEGVHLLLDGLEPRQGVELGLELLQRPRRLRAPELVELVGDPVTRVTAARGQALAEGAGDVFQWVSGHAGSIVPLERGFRPTWGRADSLTWLTKCSPPYRLTQPPSRTGSGRFCSS
jgi:hypothetical protein